MTRFRYSLRTLFVVVTVLCLWLGWEFAQVHERAAGIRETKAGEGLVQTLPLWHIYDAQAAQNVHLPFWRRWRKWFGDQGVGLLVLPISATELDIDRAHKAFPEADIGVVYNDNRNFVIVAGPEWPAEHARQREALVKSAASVWEPAAHRRIAP